MRPASAILAVGAVASVPLLLASASAQPRASAQLRPVESAGWTLVENEHGEGGAYRTVCLTGTSLYVVAVRVEPGYRGVFDLAPAGGRIPGPTGGVSIPISESDGRRRAWDAFVVEADRECFNVRLAMLTEGLPRMPGRIGLRAQLYQVLIAVDW